MIAHATKWIEVHSASVEACFIEPRLRCIMLFFVPVSDRFDFDLADDLVELNVETIKNFNVGMVESHQVTFNELDRFLNLPMARQIYGDLGKSHRAVEV